MHIGTLNLFFSLSTFFVILIAGWLPLKRKKTTSHLAEFQIGETLATGVFLGAALLHMLPESHLLFMRNGFHYPFAYLMCGSIFLIFLWFEHLGQELYHAHGHCAQHAHPTHPAFAIVAWIMLSIHSLVSGTALGFSHDNPTRMMIFLAIITHKWAESFAIAVQLNKHFIHKRHAFILFFLFACMTPLGVWLGSIFDQKIYHQTLINPMLMSISAGTFLYLGTLHGLERCVLVERCCNLKDFSFVIIGFLSMALVATIV